MIYFWSHDLSRIQISPLYPLPHLSRLSSCQVQSLILVQSHQINLLGRRDHPTQEDRSPHAHRRDHQEAHEADQPDRSLGSVGEPLLERAVEQGRRAEGEQRRGERKEEEGPVCLRVYTGSSKGK